MRSLNIHGFTFNVLDEPADYWGWVESGHYGTDFATIKRFADPNATCIDLGAWVGADTLYASSLFKHVHAVEPDPVALEMLRQNIGFNNLSNVTIYGCAIAGESGTLTIGGSVLGCSCTRVTCDQNAVTIPAVTLREFCQDIPDPLFIKMDVEGSEAQILKDWEWFRERKPDLMLSTHMCWWKETGSDGKAEYETITRVGKLYRKAFYENGAPLNFGAAYGDVIFTDKQ